MLKLRNVHPYDTLMRERVKNFIADNRDSGVRERKENLLNLAFDKGLALYIEDSNEICGCSLVYEFYEKKGSQPSFLEIGTMRITNNGKALQEMLAQLHLLQLTIGGDQLDQICVFAVVGKQSASEHVLRDNVGMRPGQPDPRLSEYRSRAGLPFHPEKPVLLADDQCLARARRSLKDLYKTDRVFKCRKGDAEIEFDLPWFSPSMLSLNN